MSEETEKALLSVLRGVPDVSKVGGGPVPLPDPTGGMEDHLFVNLTLGNLVQGEDISRLVEHLRNIAFDAFQRLRQEVDLGRYATICVSLFIPISDTEGSRIYRTRIRTSYLPSLDRANLRQVVIGEESSERELNELLNASR